MKKLVVLGLINFLLLYLPSKVFSWSKDDDLVKLLSSAQDGTAGLFSGSFTAVTVFNCHAASAKLDLLQKLSKTFLFSSDVLGIEESIERVADFAWLEALMTFQNKSNPDYYSKTLESFYLKT